MEKQAFKFSGEGALNYDTYLGPFLFEPYGIYISSLLPENARSVLEIAAGTGRLTNHLQQKLSSSATLTATDLSPDMLEIAKTKFQNDQVNFLAADIINLPFEANSFDCVFCQFGIMFLPDKQKGFDEVYRVLKPGGKFIFSTWDKPENISVQNIFFNEVLFPFFKDEDVTRFKTPFSLYDTSQLLSFLETANFKNNKVENIFREGRSNADNLVSGYLLKHSLGQEVKAKDAAALEPMGEELKAKFENKFGKEIVTMLSAFIGHGEK